MYMTHIVDRYLEHMAGPAEREEYLKRLSEPGSIVDDKLGLMHALQTDFLLNAFSESDPRVLHDKRVAFVAVASFIDSFDTVLKKYRDGAYSSQLGTSNSGGVKV